MEQLVKTLTKATKYLPETAENEPCTDGTLGDLIAKMDKYSIDKEYCCLLQQSHLSRGLSMIG